MSKMAKLIEETNNYIGDYYVCLKGIPVKLEEFKKLYPSVVFYESPSVIEFNGFIYIK